MLASGRGSAEAELRAPGAGLSEPAAGEQAQHRVLLLPHREQEDGLVCCKQPCSVGSVPPGLALPLLQRLSGSGAVSCPPSECPGARCHRGHQDCSCKLKVISTAPVSTVA